MNIYGVHLERSKGHSTWRICDAHGMLGYLVFYDNPPDKINLADTLIELGDWVKDLKGIVKE